MSKDTDGSSTAILDGYARATLFNKCLAGWSSKGGQSDGSGGARVAIQSHVHKTDVAFSATRGFAYVDNVKAGSSTVRTHLASALNVSWCAKHQHDVRKTHRGCQPRTKTADFTVDELNGAFLFSFGRDPVAKFESGVREAVRFFN